MQKLSFYIDSQSKETEAFVVDLSNTVLTQANIASVRFFSTLLRKVFVYH